MSNKDLVEKGLALVGKYNLAHHAAISFAEAWVIPFAGDAWHLQELDGPVVNIVVFADIIEANRKKLMKSIKKNGATFVQEYCLHKETGLWIRAYEVDETATWPRFYIKIMVPKEVPA